MTSRSSENLDKYLFRKHLSTFTNIELRKIATPWTMVSIPHFDLALDAVKIVNEKGIRGDIVECGVSADQSFDGSLCLKGREGKVHFWLVGGVRMSLT